MICLYVGMYVGNMKRKRGMWKRGMSAEVLVALVLIILFALIVLRAIIIPLTKEGFKLGLKERICQISVSLNRVDLPGPMTFPVICKTEIIKIDKEYLDDNKRKGEDLKVTAVRTVLDKMARCKFMIEGDADSTFYSQSHCYICYAVEVKEGMPEIEHKDLEEYAMENEIRKGKSYMLELAEDKHDVMLAFEGKLREGRDYGIVYVDTQKAGKSLWLVPFAGAGVCVMGIAGRMGALGLPGTQAGGRLVSMLTCNVPVIATSAALGSIYSLSEFFRDIGNENTIMLADLKNVNEICNRALVSRVVS